MCHTVIQQSKFLFTFTSSRLYQITISQIHQTSGQTSGQTSKRMKIKAIIVISTCIFSFQVMHSQVNDLKKLTLHGNVKSLRERFYKPVTKEGNIEKGELEYSYFNTFNNLGNKTDDLKYSADGKIDKTYAYKYDSLGRRIEQNQFTSDGKLSRRIIYKYDEKGNITEDNSYNHEGSFDKKYTYKYDSQRNVIEDNSFDSSHKLLKKFTYDYDGSGNKSESSQYTADGKPDKKSVYKYDMNRNIIEETITTPDGMQVRYTYLYEFDKKYNWTRKIKFSEGKAVNLVEREIEYY
jgi:hypothetical protein